MAHAFVGTPMGFGLARVFLGLSESGNFPAAIKATGFLHMSARLWQVLSMQARTWA
jgi:hypothetical protein